MIKNGRPYSNENGSVDDALITARSEKEINIVCEWIMSNFIRRKTPLMDYTSYGMKHILERETGIYLTNNEFKDAMLKCGFEPVNPNALNWSYCLSKKSPAFCQKHNY